MNMAMLTFSSVALMYVVAGSVDVCISIFMSDVWFPYSVSASLSESSSMCRTWNFFDEWADGVFGEWISGRLVDLIWIGGVMEPEEGDKWLGG